MVAGEFSSCSGTGVQTTSQGHSLAKFQLGSLKALGSEVVCGGVGSFLDLGEARVLLDRQRFVSLEAGLAGFNATQHLQAGTAAGGRHVGLSL